VGGRRIKLARPAALVACLAAAGGVHAAQWENHVDASMITEIVPRDDVLYMTTFGGLLLYDVGTGRFEQYDNVSGLPSNALNCLAFDADGDIYIGTDDIGVAKVRLVNGHLSLLRSLSEQIDGIAGSRVNSIALWGSDIVYGSTPGAGIIRNDFAAARYYARDGLPADDVLDVLPVGNTVWMATDGGVAVLDRLGLISLVPGGPAEANVLGTDGAMVWVGTDSGVRRFDPSTSSWTDVGPVGFRIYSFAWDGSMWAGSTRNLFHYSGAGQAWTQVGVTSVTSRYNTTGGTNAILMRGLGLSSNGDVYMGGVQPVDRRGVNLLRYEGTTVTNLFPNGAGANDVRRLTVDTDGSVWASFFNFYVGKLTPAGTWVNYNSPLLPDNQLPSNQSANLAFLADADGHKWFCTLDKLTNTLDELDDRLDTSYANDVWTRHTLGSGGGDGLGSLSFQRAREDPAGNRWFLGDVSETIPQSWQGINVLSKDKSAWLQKSPANDAAMISGNVVDVVFEQDFAYVATLNKGIQKWYHQGYAWSDLSSPVSDFWTTPIQGGDLPTSADVRSLALRSDGVLWIATDGGLFRYDSLDDPVLREIPVYIGIGAGILSSGVNDVLLDHDENLWVATNSGLNRIARDDENDIQAFTTAAGFVALSGLRYPLSVISPLAHADCRSLALHRTKNIIYIGTFGGLSIYDATATQAVTSDVSKVYVYPNPVYGSRGQTTLKVENLPGPVTIEVYNLEGELVHTQSAQASGDVIWDLTDRSGFLVGSGKYIVRIASSGGSVTRPIAVIR
jgi:ligand-binding sensor domain-containing protein